uniref:RNA helicase n=1 Tax=Parastrongyloides trichosuri TaxID=131310 RepID=A0A0N4Z9A9_PARTI
MENLNDTNNIEECNNGEGKNGNKNYVPVDRDVDIIFEEDKENSKYYSRTDELDDDVIVLFGSNCTVKYETWAECEFDPKLLKNINKCGYQRPRKIQAFTMPFVSTGVDVKSQAETGSGKTAAFLLPIIDTIIKDDPPRESRSPLAVIISPTRELALQTHEQARKFTIDTGVTAAKVYGQYALRENLAELDRGCDIVSATPGRLKHLVEEGELNLGNLKFLVLDEADELIAANFISVLKEIVSMGNCPDKEKRTNLLFSATFSIDIEDLCLGLMKQDHAVIINNSCNEVNKRITHEFLKVPRNEKNKALIKLLKEQIKEDESNNQKIKRTLVFVEKKRQADMLAIALISEKISAVSLNGDRPQRIREEALNNFRSHKVDVLVATDVCARGLDIKDLDHVINVDLPNNYYTFVHRVGRTGRFHQGKATSFYDPEANKDLRDQYIKALINNGQELPDFFKDEK